MNTLNHFRNWVTLAFLVLLLLVPIGVVQAQTPVHLTVTVTGQALTAGFKNNVTLTATNSYSSASIYPSGTIYDVDLAVSVPTPLQLSGDNHWHYDSIALGQSVSISFQVYAAIAAIGSSYQGSVTLTYRQLGSISYTQETHEVGFSVHGWINLVLYGVQLSPSAVAPGGNATISGNLLNKGNIAAYNANVTVESEAIAQGTTASVFLGEVDANIPRPFSLLVNFRKNLADGNYSIVVKVSAVDTNMAASPYSAQQASQLQIKKPVVQPPGVSQRGAGGVLGTIFEILRFLYGLFFGFWSMATSVWRTYSYFNASTAFIFEALHAGYSPAAVANITGNTSEKTISPVEKTG
jgi:hypothetical protein